MLNKILTVILTSLQFAPLSVLGCEIIHQRDVKERIFFGKDANPSDFLSMVRLEFRDIKNDKTLCGGSIIADQWIITPAHCLHEQKCELTKIFPSKWTPGSSSISKPLECHIHEKFDIKKNRNDIGLIKTTEDLIQDGLTATIPLPNPGQRFPDGTNAVILGWGLTNEAVFPDQLIRGDVRIENWDICNLKQRYHLGECDEELTCTGPRMSVKVFCTQGEAPFPPSSCSGDSGSPAIVDGVLAGVTSYTIAINGVCLRGSPTMHVNLVDYLPWIYSFVDPERDTSQMQVLKDPEEL